MATITVPISCQWHNLPIVITSAVTNCFMARAMFGRTGAPSKRGLDPNVNEIVLSAAMPGLSGSLMGVPAERQNGCAFAASIDLLRIVFAFGMNSTRKHVRSDHAENIGTGSVGQADHLGSCLLTVLSGALADLTSVRNSNLKTMRGVAVAALLRLVRGVARKFKIMGHTRPALPPATCPASA